MVNKKIVVACSGGPDSMALLDQLYKKGQDIVVAHVNYQKRDSALRDENIVRAYCQKRNIDIEVLYPTFDGKGNFQSWAREVRYDFFFKVADRYHTKDVYVAHQMDDHIETFFFQMHRNMLCDTFGLNSEINMNGYWIHRPCLDATKSELEQYCIDHNLAYGIDESNLTDIYTRNRIRHELCDHIPRKTKEMLLQVIQQANEKYSRLRKDANEFIKTWKYDIKSLLDQEEPWFILEMYLSSKTKKHYSEKHMESLLKQIQTNCLIDLQDYELESFNQKLYLEKKIEIKECIIDSIQYQDYGHFAFLKEGKKIESIHVEKDDFPLTIRVAKESDKIQLRYGTKKVSRFFIDRKIPRIYRKRWLVCVNRENKVIFVPGIGCDVEHFSIHSNLFMVQYLSYI